MTFQYAIAKCNYSLEYAIREVVAEFYQMSFE